MKLAQLIETISARDLLSVSVELDVFHLRCPVTIFVVAIFLHKMQAVLLAILEAAKNDRVLVGFDFS